MEAAPGFEPGIKVLQTRALPLGYGAMPGLSLVKGTRQFSMKGRERGACASGRGDGVIGCLGDRENPSGDWSRGIPPPPITL